MKPLDVALAATLHDPQAALLGHAQRLVESLQQVYGAIAVTTSPPTAQRMNQCLRDLGIFAGTPRSNRRGPLYRLAVRRALASGASRVHYLDFDRALHWACRDPASLRRTLTRVPVRDVVVLGRTSMAHRSHQQALYATEKPVNAILSARLGRGRVIDFLAPSLILRREAAARLLACSRAQDEDIYGEWAALVAQIDPDFAYAPSNRLDWETPDRARAEVRRIGLNRWRKRFDSELEWSLRVKLASAVLRGFEAALARHGDRSVSRTKSARRHS